MTQHNNRKLSAVCSQEDYEWLDKWIKDQHPNVPSHAIGTPLNYFYRNTAHREYMSKFLESVIIKVLKSKGAKPVKADDKGVRVDKTKTVTDVTGRKRTIGSAIYAKNHKYKVGTADVTCFHKGIMWNYEVKVGADSQSPEQKAEQKRAESNGEKYVIIKTVRDFLNTITDEQKKL